MHIHIYIYIYICIYIYIYIERERERETQRCGQAAGAAQAARAAPQRQPDIVINSVYVQLRVSISTVYGDFLKGKLS